jgi:hypothetical protein
MKAKNEFAAGRNPGDTLLMNRELDIAREKLGDASGSYWTRHPLMLEFLRDQALMISFVFLLAVAGALIRLSARR